MREACGGQAVRLGAKPLAHTFTLDQGVGGWGAAPSARSTPTLWHTRSVTPQGHAQKIKRLFNNYG
ncbi:MAG: hypothetical protein NZ455_09080 [Bacteroidia bacterium]|nr:hypothetical protein [Bacteroidia bacterium]MDW8346024.1 hypothetical protein [Bacteroidia bacterium]